MKKALAEARTESVAAGTIMTLTSVRLILLMRGYPLIVSSGLRIRVLLDFLVFHGNTSLH